MVASVNFLPKIGTILHIRLKKMANKGQEENNSNTISLTSSIALFKNSLSF
mgnify:CR=1 FL=1